MKAIHLLAAAVVFFGFVDKAMAVTGVGFAKATTSSEFASSEVVSRAATEVQVKALKRLLSSNDLQTVLELQNN